MRVRGYLDSPRWAPRDRQKLEKTPATTRLRSRRGSSRSGWRAATSTREATGDAGGELLDRDPAAQRDRRAAHGARAERLDPGRAHADEPDAGQEHAVGSRHRPRRDRDAVGGREGAARPRASPATTSAARSSSSGSGSGKRSTARGSSSSTSASAPPATTSASASRSTTATCGPSTGLQAALRQGLHLPRQLHGQLGPGLALGDLRPRGREPRGRRTRSTRSTTRSRAPTGSSPSRPCARRRCSPTPRSP